MATAKVSVHTIMGMLASTHKNLQLNVSDIANWCGECIEEIGEFTAMERFRDVKLTIKNNIAELPCNVFRVLTVSKGGMTPVYTVDHPYIKFKSYSGDVLIDYLGIPVDDDGYPQIDRKARQACYWFCLKKLKQEDYENGKVGENVWDKYENNEAYYIDKARGNMGNMSRDDLNRITKVMVNMVAQPFIPSSFD